MSNSIGGHCGKCGAPFYVPTIWHGITPPPPQPTCGCWNTGNVVTTDKIIIKVPCEKWPDSEIEFGSQEQNDE